MKEVAPAILAAQPIVGGTGVEDRSRGGLREARDGQQIRRSKIGHDEAGALLCEVAEGRGDIAVFRGDAFDQLEGLAGEMPGRVVIGDGKAGTLYPLVLRRLIEVGERQ